MAQNLSVVDFRVLGQDAIDALLDFFGGGYVAMALCRDGAMARWRDGGGRP